MTRPAIGTTLPPPGDPAWDSARWRASTDDLAARIVATIGPQRTVDLGSGRGHLVAALAALGADAYGVTPDSDLAAAMSARAGIGVAPMTADSEGSWTLVSCLQTLESLPRVEAEKLLADLCSEAQFVLFSSVLPAEAGDQHRHLRTPQAWAAAFAERGFLRRLDVDLAFFSATTALYERSVVTPREVVHRYEDAMAPLTAELIARRANSVDHNHDRELRHQLLVSTDHAIGAAAEVAVLRAEVSRLHQELAGTRARVDEQSRALADVGDVRSSTTWRVGRAVVGPAAALRLRIRRSR